MSVNISVDRDRIGEFCRRWRITKLELFGSVLRDDFDGESDVDVLVSFAAAARPSLFDHVAMQDELSDILGREVDLVSRRAIEASANWVRRKAILNSAEPFYVVG